MGGLGFCSGSDRYYAVGNAPGHWSIHDCTGAHVLDVSAPVRTDTMEQIHAVRASLEAVRPPKFDVGKPDELNRDLFDPTRESRVHMVSLFSHKDTYKVELSDGSTVPWEVWSRDVRERVG